MGSVDVVAVGVLRRVEVVAPDDGVAPLVDRVAPADGVALGAVVMSDGLLPSDAAVEPHAAAIRRTAIAPAPAA